MTTTTSAARPPVERVHPPDWLMRLFNPVARRLLKRGKPAAMAQQIVLLHFRGRRS